MCCGGAAAPWAALPALLLSPEWLKGSRGAPGQPRPGQPHSLATSCHLTLLIAYATAAAGGKIGWSDVTAIIVTGSTLSPLAKFTDLNATPTPFPPHTQTHTNTNLDSSATHLYISYMTPWQMDRPLEPWIYARFLSWNNYNLSVCQHVHIHNVQKFEGKL